MTGPHHKSIKKVIKKSCVIVNILVLQTTIEAGWIPSVIIGQYNPTVSTRQKPIAVPVNLGVGLEMDKLYPHSFESSISCLYYDINKNLRYSQVIVPLYYKYYYYSQKRHFNEMHVDVGILYSYLFSNKNTFQNSNRYGLSLKVGYECIVSMNFWFHLYFNNMKENKDVYATWYSDLQPFLTIELKLPYLFDG